MKRRRRKEGRRKIYIKPTKIDYFGKNEWSTLGSQNFIIQTSIENFPRIAKIDSKIKKANFFDPMSNFQNYQLKNLIALISFAIFEYHLK